MEGQKCCKKAKKSGFSDGNDSICPAAGAGSGGNLGLYRSCDQCCDDLLSLCAERLCASWTVRAELLCTGGLWGVGAYLAGNILLKTGGGTLTAFVVAIAGTALLAFVLGFAFFRLKQYYFTFASIGLMTILNGVFMNWEPFSGGAVGMKNIPTFTFFGWQATTEAEQILHHIGGLHRRDGADWPAVPVISGAGVYGNPR